MFLPFPFWVVLGPFSGASAVGRVGSNNVGCTESRKNITPSLATGILWSEIFRISQIFLPGFDAAEKKNQQSFLVFLGGSWYLG